MRTIKMKTDKRKKGKRKDMGARWKKIIVRKEKVIKMTIRIR